MNAARYRSLLSILVLAGLAGTARAHEIAGRFAAPIPLELLFGGAAVTVGITAIVIGLVIDDRPASPKRLVATISPGVARHMAVTSRGLFFLAFVLVIITGVLGRQVPAENFATLFVWAVWLKGIAIVAALIGSPWQILSPWRTLYDGLTVLEGTRIALRDEYPAWLGPWPALGGFLVWIGIIENLTHVPRSPQLTAYLLIGYTVVMVIGGVLFGPRWFRDADSLAVLYRLFGRVAPIHGTPTGDGGYRVHVRPPWADCTRSVRGYGFVAFVIATVYTVSFDGMTSTPEFQTILFNSQNALGAGVPVGIVLYFGGFLGFLAGFSAITIIMQWVARAPLSEWQSIAFGFAPTVLPIAVAYEIAHNYPLVLGNAGQLPGVLMTIGMPGHGPTVSLLGWLSLPAYWWSQIFLIVGGHIIAVVAAHSVALSRYDTIGSARRAHLPFVGLMVGYTVLSLWIISRPIVTG